MSLRHTIFAAFSVGFAFIGCKDKPAPQGATVAPDIPPPTPSTSAVVTPAPSASATEVSPIPPGHRFTVHHRATRKHPVAFLGAGIVLCQDDACRADAFLITEKGLTDTYNPLDAMNAKDPKNFPKNEFVGFVYRGEYPQICATLVFEGDRTGTGGPTVKRTGKTWAIGECPESSAYNEEPPAPRPPREFDEALLHAPIANAAKTIVYGASAPPMLIAPRALYVWEGKTWSKREAPWEKTRQTFERRRYPVSQRLTRLTSGATLVTEGGYLIDAKGEISPVHLIQDDKSISPNVEVIGALWTKDFPWLVGLEGNEFYLATPDKSDNISYVRATIASRVVPTTKTSTAAARPSPAPEPSPSASAATSAAAPPSTPASASGLTEPKPFTAACTTPFVLLASPPKPGQAYATTREGLRGHGELQDLGTFLELVIEGKTYFGVQTKTEADAKQLMDVVETSVKGMKPALRCLDVLSLVTDRYAPPEGIRVVGINLTTGELVPFD